MEYARHQFILNARQKDGATLRQHLQAVFSQTGKMPDQLANAPDMPEALAHVWIYFLELNRSRGNNGFSELHITFSEIDSWCRLYGISLEPWELSIIAALDNAYLTEQAKKKND